MHKLAQPLIQALTYPVAASLSGLSPFLGGGSAPEPTNLITNGGFDDDSAWVLNTGATISGGKLVFTEGVGVYQSIAPLAPGATYNVQFTVSGYVSGDVTIVTMFGGSTTFYTPRSANGMYSEDIVPINADDVFFVLADGAMSVDDVSLVYLSPAPPVEIAQTLYDHETKTYTGSNEPGAELTCGIVFQSSTQGEVREISFWKTAADVATSRTVGLYLATGGGVLATGTSTGEPVGVAGWVTVELDTPYTIDALESYVAAVFFPEGAYAYLADEIITPITRGDLTAEGRSSAPGGQCRYAYGATIVYPNSQSEGGSFGVDVGFFPDPPAGGGGTEGPLTPMSGHVSLWPGGDSILENVDLDGYVTVHMENCIIRNCRISNSLGGASVIRVDTNDSTGAGLLVENCEIDGLGINTNGISGEGTFRNNTIVGVDNGINVYGPSLITGNYIYLDESSAPEPHFDGIEVNGGNNIVIRHNTIILMQGQTSAIMLNNFAAGLSNIDVIDNDLSGGGYTIYVDDRFAGGAVDGGSIRIMSNRLGTGLFGYFALYTSGVTPVGNVDATTGDPV